MSENAWNRLGAEIRDAVTDALTTGNFRDFGETITDSVKDFSSQFSKTGANQTSESVNYTQKYASATRARQSDVVSARKREMEQAKMEEEKKAPFRSIGSISGWLYAGIGGFLLAAFGISSFALFLLAALSPFGGVAWFSFGFCLCFAVAGGVSLGIGVTKRGRLKRAMRYRELCGHNHYCNLDVLAKQIGKSEKFVRKDLKKMFELGFFPEGHLDAEETCLILDDKIYAQYLALEKQMMEAKNEQARQTYLNEKKHPSKQTSAEDSASESELAGIIREGQSYIRELRDLNDAIPGEEISAKLFCLENLLKEIFDSLASHPEQMPQMKKFMNYYLPMTLKLVKSYEEFDSLSMPSEEVLDAKREICDSLDTINGAFEELLKRLFRDVAYDAATDAQVLQQMLAQEGLSKTREFETVTRKS